MPKKTKADDMKQLGKEAAIAAQGGVGKDVMQDLLRRVAKALA